MDKRAVILNSRQSLQPRGADRWIVQTRRAVRYAKSRGYTLVTSVGMSAWEMTLYFASRFGARREVIVPRDENAEPDEIRSFWTAQFRLDDKLTGWHEIPRGRIARDRAVFQKTRDRMALERAEIILPVDIRSGGNLEGRLFRAERAGKTIDRTFRTVQTAPERTCKIVVDSSRLSPETDSRLGDALVHWTRTCHGPWPGETRYDYYHAVASNADRYPRRALDTLCRILTERRLRASPRHLRRGLRAVAFSALPPTDAVGLMKWRARYREMTFEPYGLAIERSLAEKLKIRRVFYGNPDMYDYLEPENRDYFQNLGRVGDWMPEREYRHLGDFELESIPGDRLTAIVLQPEDIDTIRRVHSGSVLALYADKQGNISI